MYLNPNQTYLTGLHQRISRSLQCKWDLVSSQDALVCSKVQDKLESILEKIFFTYPVPPHSTRENVKSSSFLQN